jgi:hypothetical protein
VSASARAGVAGSICCAGRRVQLGRAEAHRARVRSGHQRHGVEADAQLDRLDTGLLAGSAFPVVDRPGSGSNLDEPVAQPAQTLAGAGEVEHHLRARLLRQERSARCAQVGAERLRAGDPHPVVEDLAAARGQRDAPEQDDRGDGVSESAAGPWPVAPPDRHGAPARGRGVVAVHASYHDTA